MRLEDYPLGFGHEREADKCPQCELVIDRLAEAEQAIRTRLNDEGIQVTQVDPSMLT
jgi:hypothetical protein